MADDDVKLSGAREITCACVYNVCVCVCGVCVSIEKRVPQLLMVKRDLKTTVCPSDRERLRGHNVGGGDELSDGGEREEDETGDDEEEEMFSVIEPVHGMSVQ